MTGILEDANICAAHAKRITVLEKVNIVYIY
jgi:histone H3/H4